MGISVTLLQLYEVSMLADQFPVRGGPWTSLSWPPVPGGLVVGTFYSSQLALVGEDASHGPCGRGHEVARL